MKVLFTLLDAGVGGGQLVATRVATALRDRGDEVGLVVPGPGPAADRFVELNARVAYLEAGSLRRPGSARRLSRLLGSYDLLYSHTSLPGVIIGSAAARLARRPHVVHQHTYPYFSRSQPGRVGQRLLFPRVAGDATFIAVAPHVRSGLVEAGIRAEQIHVVPNGVPLADPEPRPAGDEILVGVLARLDPGKNLDVFVAAVAQVKARTPTRFVLSGVSSPFSDYERGLRARAAAAGVQILPGTDGEGFLRTLDIVAIPSAYEGSPLVLLEAMALSRAVIASDIPGMREVVGTDAGLLVPPGDADALASAVTQLADDPDLRAAVGARAVAVVRERYALASVLERTLAILDGAGRPSTP